MRKRAIGDAALSVGALGVLIAILAAMDDRMREQVMLRVNGDPSAQLSSAGTTIRAVAAVAMDAIRTQSIEHAPLMIFVLLAIVLFLFMLRT